MTPEAKEALRQERLRRSGELENLRAEVEALKRRLTAVRDERRAALDKAVSWVQTTLGRVLKA
jgi:Skp family chaperone for outer membrane proteins